MGLNLCPRPGEKQRVLQLGGTGRGAAGPVTQTAERDLQGCRLSGVCLWPLPALSLLSYSLPLSLADRSVPSS